MIIVYKMQYMGDILDTDIELQLFNEKFYDIYERVYNECFYEMRKELNIKPYNFYNSIEQLVDKKANLWLLFENNDLVGSVACIDNEIDDLIVNKKYQKQGYGKKLLFFAISYLQKNNIYPIILHVTKWNENAIRLYSKYGFKCVYVKEIS